MWAVSVLRSQGGYGCRALDMIFCMTANQWRSRRAGGQCKQCPCSGRQIVALAFTCIFLSFAMRLQIADDHAWLDMPAVHAIPITCLHIHSELAAELV